MDWTHIIWDDLPGGNVEHVEEHDLTTDEVDYVLETTNPKASAAAAVVLAFSVTLPTAATSPSFTKRKMTTR